MLLATSPTLIILIHREQLAVSKALPYLWPHVSLTFFLDDVCVMMFVRVCVCVPVHLCAGVGQGTGLRLEKRGVTCLRSYIQLATV